MKKKCFVHVIHMVSIRELIHIICLRGTFFFFVSVLMSVDLSVDLEIFYRMETEPSG